jgi:phage baseplate assembly protein gpV
MFGDIVADNEIPSQNPADSADMASAFRMMFNKLLQNVDGGTPATVISYDRKRNVAKVKPQIRLLLTSGESFQPEEYAEIPVLSVGCSLFTINFPIKRNDLGWLIACDRDISLYLQTLKESPPNTKRLHKFSHGFFVPDTVRQYIINAEDEENMVIQSADGQLRIAIGSGKVKITAPLVVVDAPQTKITGRLEVDGATKLNDSLGVKGESTMESKISANGGLVASDAGGGATLPSNTTIGGIKPVGHVHVSNAPGVNTGPMKDGG